MILLNSYSPRFDLVNARGDQVGAFVCICQDGDKFEALVQPTAGGIAYGAELYVRFDFFDGAEAYATEQVKKIEARFARLQAKRMSSK